MYSQTHSEAERPSGSDFLSKPYGLLKLRKADGGKFSRNDLTVLSAIYCFSAHSDKRCNLSYAGFTRLYNVSPASVARAVKRLKDEELIVQDKSNPAHASYTYTGPSMKKSSITVNYFLYHVKFKVKGEAEPRLLTKSAVDVLSHIMTHELNQKGNGFTGSQRGIAAALQLTKKTVQSAIRLLMKADLIYQPKEYKGVNTHKRSRYVLNTILLMKARKQFERELGLVREPVKQPAQDRSFAPRSVSDADARAARERYYAELRRHAESRAEKFLGELNADTRYAELSKQRRALQVELGKAAAYNLPTLEELRRKEKSLDVRISRRMKELQISVDDITPVYHCKKCKDTGFDRKTGKPCDCYPSPRRRST